ncbi:integrase_H2C2 domain-containing protein [Trichonephila clavipes]|nr:integrase_H2C2 domain-containing protein [Trichonephila clavipes]
MRGRLLNSYVKKHLVHLTDSLVLRKFLLIVDGLQTFDVLPSSTGNFQLIVDGQQTCDVLPRSTGNFLLIVDGLPTFDVLPSSTGDSSTHRGRTADLLMCCPVGAPNFLRSIDASAIFLVGTHMIAELSSRDGTFLFLFLAGCNFFCAVYLREGGNDGRPELPNLEFALELAWNLFTSPRTRCS